MSPLRRGAARLAWYLLGMAALATALVFSATGPVHADPTPSAIEQQIDQQWGQLEKVIEDYNKTTGDLRDNKAKAAQLESQLAPLRKKVDDMYARVGAISSSYQGLSRKCPRK